jgi:hypothetical protein
MRHREAPTTYIRDRRQTQLRHGKVLRRGGLGEAGVKYMLRKPEPRKSLTWEPVTVNVLLGLFLIKRVEACLAPLMLL